MKITHCPHCAGPITYTRRQAGQPVGCPHCGEALRLPQSRPVAAIILSILIGILVIGALLRFRESGRTSGPAVTVTTDQINPAPYFRGSVHNNCKVPIEDVIITASAYDERGNKLAIVKDSIAEIGANETWRFKIYVPNSEASALRIESVTTAGRAVY